MLRSNHLRVEKDSVVRRRISGVLVGGVVWRMGAHCLFNTGADDGVRFGTVSDMFHGTDEMTDDFVIFRVEMKRITSCHGHYCMFSNTESTTKTVFVFWGHVTWRCKVFLQEGGGMALPYHSCSSRELVEFDSLRL
jgi:hypothetical protein